MTRPVVVSVTHRADGPVMQLRFPGPRWITVRVRGAAETPDELQRVAEAEVAAMDETALELLEEAAEPAAAHHAREHAADQARRSYAGPVYCPACGAPVGRGNPALASVKQCRACGRRITARVVGEVIDVRAEGRR